MNVITAVQNYIIKMVEGVRGMKVILLDQETMGIMSMVFSQNEILQQEVYLFELLETSTREVMTHLKAICFLRPTPANLTLLSEELKNPKYEQYHLFFTNTLKSTYLEELAQSDEHEVVHQVHEIFADYFAINEDTFSLNLESTVALSPLHQKAYLDRVCDGLGAVLLSLKRRPVIRYEKTSEIAQRTAQELTRIMRAPEERTLFDFTRRGGLPVLLILDRRSDPVTPLLTQWTYQAMVHELIGIKNSRVIYNGGRTEVVLSPLQDDFFRANIYSNFGDLSLNIKKKVQELQAHGRNNQNIQSIEDMKNFIQNYPEYQKLSGNVTKHLNLLEEMMRITNDRELLVVSEVEQELAANNDHSTAVKMLTDLITNPKIKPSDKLKTVLLYALRYEKHSSCAVSKFVHMLHEHAGMDQRDVNTLVKTLHLYAGAAVRSGDVFGNKSWLAKAKGSLKRGMQGATNVYTQHKPLLVEQLLDLARAKLSEIDYPAMGEFDRGIPSDIIVFFVGGATFEEAVAIRELKELPEFKNTRIVLGGSHIHNSRSFLSEMKKLRDATYQQ